MEATAVIGANFGDEGKGLMTDYLCAPHGRRCIVVRFNGGAQAGHTVVTPGGTSGTRHVFHHFGSGTLSGGATYLSRFFIVNPLLWRKELDELPVRPLVLVDPAAMLTTPYDMLINQEAERERGTGRHGSCGVGINETVTRCAAPAPAPIPAPAPGAGSGSGPLGTFVRDCADPAGLRAKLLAIRRDYVPARMGELGIVPRTRFAELVGSDSLLETYLALAQAFWRGSRVCDEQAIAEWPHVVFEGAQGLLLDQDHRFFPHVTRSKTGLCNVIAIAGKLGLDKLRVIYLTRAYMTRHGTGPFPTEDPALRYPDPTNVPNEFQGSLRFGRLDLDLLKESIAGDLASAGPISVAPELGVTCLDQVKDAGALLGEIADRAGVPIRHTSFGPTRADVRDAQRPRPITIVEDDDPCRLRVGSLEQVLTRG